MRLHAFTIMLCAVLSSGCELALSGFADCSYTAEREATISTAGASRIRVLAQAGSLDIVGRANLAEVRASGTACAGSQARVDEVVLLTRREGDDVVVETRTEHGRLDLRVELPASLPVVVDDSSGSVHIADVAEVTLDDNFGSVRIERVGGDVSIRDGSGDLDIETVGGAVRIEDDGSGSIAIATVTGDVLIERDGSGGIDVTTVSGTVTIERDGSGGIAVSDVTEDVVIAEDGSGSIRVTDVRGDFSVGRDGSGRIDFDRVGGQVTTP